MPFSRQRSRYCSLKGIHDFLFHSLFLPCSLQLQLASLEENKKQSMKMIQDLQNTIDHKEVQIQSLSKQITAREREQMNGARMAFELENMKRRKIALEEEVSSLRGAAKLSQEEASCYQEHATALRRATPTKVELRA